jgi:hypothetical protein
MIIERARIGLRISQNPAKVVDYGETGVRFVAYLIGEIPQSLHELSSVAGPVPVADELADGQGRSILLGLTGHIVLEPVQEDTAQGESCHQGHDTSENQCCHSKCQRQSPTDAHHPPPFAGLVKR